MRLLQYNNDGEFSLTKDLFGDDIPDYAILSHTWGTDTEEVTYRDMIEGTGKNKVGYEKIWFCGEQARRGGFDYIWIDTCCIDKTNNIELSEAINSMFRCYQEAKVCFAYLADVPSGEDPAVLDSSFSKSRWFTRGWTLQELIAPPIVVFFAKNWERIGDKKGLQSAISRITSIPTKFLLGVDNIDRASIAQRMSWASGRQTTKMEDIAYCLLGIFGMHMPLLYGEGMNAFLRLQEEIIKASDDQSIFAWRSRESPSNNVTCGLLAPSPGEFEDSGSIVPSRISLGIRHLTAARSPITINNKGLEVSLPQGKTGEQKYYFASLLCVMERPSDEWVGILLKDISYHGGRYERYSPHELVLLSADTVRRLPVRKLNFSRTPETPETPEMSRLSGPLSKRLPSWRFKWRLGRLNFSPTFRVETENRLSGWATVKR
jgi:hypothetical protein